MSNGIVTATVNVSRHLCGKTESKSIKGNFVAVESVFWKAVSREVMAIVDELGYPEVGETPAAVSVVLSNGDRASFALTARGTYAEYGGEEKPSPFFCHESPDLDFDEWTETRAAAAYNDKRAAYDVLRRCWNGIEFDEEGEYEDKCLVYCSPNTKGGCGSYKLYKLGVDLGECIAEYGRIVTFNHNELRAARAIPAWMFWLRYREKIAKGYQDMSEVFLAADDFDSLSLLGLGEKTEEFSRENTAAAIELLDILQGCAVRMVRNCTSLRKEDINSAMVIAAREGIEELNRIAGDDSFGNDSDKLQDFNRAILHLMCVSPRPVDCVSGFLAKDLSAAEVNKVIERETSLTRAMEAIYTGKEIGKLSGGTVTFHQMGIQVRDASEEEIKEIQSLMLDPYTGEDEGGYIEKVKKVWRITPRVQGNRYEAYKESRGIEEEKLLFHGSSSASWLSCIENSLDLCYAKAGGMFGAGHYFANQFRKAAGYADGGWWRRGGGENHVFVGVYRVASGKEKPMKCADHSLNRKTLPDEYDSVHAFKGESLRNDEIVVYDDAACCIEFLIEIAA